MRTVAAEAAGTDASASAKAGTTWCKIDRVVMACTPWLTSIRRQITRHSEARQEPGALYIMALVWLCETAILDRHSRYRRPRKNRLGAQLYRQGGHREWCAPTAFLRTDFRRRPRQISRLPCRRFSNGCREDTHLFRGNRERVRICRTVSSIGLQCPWRQRIRSHSQKTGPEGYFRKIS